MESFNKPSAGRGLRGVLLSLLLPAFLLVGCGEQSYEEAHTASDSASSLEEGLTPGSPLGEPRARVVTLTVSVTVADVMETVDRLRAFAEAEEGYLEQSEVRVSGGDYAAVRMRVPSDRLEAVREQLRDLGEVTAEEERVQDVTAERADLRARLRNARASEQSLLALAANEGGTLTDLLAVEREVSRVREDVERLEAQERTLEGSIQYANVVVNLRAPAAPFWRDPAGTLGGAAEVGVELLYAGAVSVGVLVAALGPTALLLLLGLFVVVRVFRFRRASRMAA